jgi:phosphoribosylaminoimidazole (AIR) synthetase
MLRTFKRGVGSRIVVPRPVAKALETVELAGKTCQVVGRITRGERRVHYIGKLRYAGE